jgi:hypothetical protein
MLMALRVKQQDEQNDHRNGNAEQPEENRGHGKILPDWFVNAKSVRNRAIRIQEKMNLMKRMSSPLHHLTALHL